MSTLAKQPIKSVEPRLEFEALQVSDIMLRECQSEAIASASYERAKTATDELPAEYFAAGRYLRGAIRHIQGRMHAHFRGDRTPAA